MNSVIENLKNLSLSGNDIYNACEKNIKILKNSDLHKFKNIDAIFNPYDCVALLYEVKPSYGHWVLLIRHKNSHTIEFFDSYGYFIDDQLKYINSKFRKKSNQDDRYLSRLLVKSDYNIIYNKVRVQEMKNGVSSCGRHLCLRYLMKHIDLDKYIKIIKKSDLKNTDDLVTYLTAFI